MPATESKPEGNLATESKGVVLMRYRICSCSVCAPVTLMIDEVEAIVNAAWPTGLNSKWSVVEKGFGLAPIACADDPKRMHYLLVC
jgi:hypothetical protein